MLNCIHCGLVRLQLTWDLDRELRITCPGCGCVRNTGMLLVAAGAECQGGATELVATYGQRPMLTGRLA